MIKGSFIAFLTLLLVKKNENKHNERTRDYECEDASNNLRPQQLFSTTLHHGITDDKNSRY